MRDSRQHGETQERLCLRSAWREPPSGGPRSDAAGGDSRGRLRLFE